MAGRSFRFPKWKNVVAAKIIGRGPEWQLILHISRKMSETQFVIWQYEKILNALVTSRSRVDFWKKSGVWIRVISNYKYKSILLFSASSLSASRAPQKCQTDEVKYYPLYSLNKIFLRMSFRKRIITFNWLLIFFHTFDICLEKFSFLTISIPKSLKCPLMARKIHAVSVTSRTRPRCLLSLTNIPFFMGPLIGHPHIMRYACL